MFGDYHDFPGLKSFIRIVASREIDGKVMLKLRQFVVSQTESGRAAGSPLRALAYREWPALELDVAMGEDAARNRKNNDPAKIAFPRRRACDLVAAAISKGSLAVKLKRAGWDADYRQELLMRVR